MTATWIIRIHASVGNERHRGDELISAVQCAQFVVVNDYLDESWISIRARTEQRPMWLGKQYGRAGL